jgi:hypothetical protein
MPKYGGLLSEAIFLKDSSMITRHLLGIDINFKAVRVRSDMISLITGFFGQDGIKKLHERYAKTSAKIHQLISNSLSTLSKQKRHSTGGHLVSLAHQNLSVTKNDANNIHLNRNKLKIKPVSSSPKDLKLKQVQKTLEIGGFWGMLGRSQHINSVNLTGDDYSVNKRDHFNFLFGAGLFIDYKKSGANLIQYGLNAFYLPFSKISGDITQETIFTNLAYQYRVDNLPVYFVSKWIRHIDEWNRNVFLDLGVGPNFMFVGRTKERSLDNGITLPDNPFVNKTNVVFSAMFGLGIELQNKYKNITSYCTYRFFYLGQGHFNHKLPLLLNTLNTGHGIANAITCTAAI